MVIIVSIVFNLGERVSSKAREKSSPKTSVSQIKTAWVSHKILRQSSGHSLLRLLSLICLNTHGEIHVNRKGNHHSKERPELSCEMAERCEMCNESMLKPIVKRRH